jgi:hypothetical protein
MTSERAYEPFLSKKWANLISDLAILLMNITSRLYYYVEDAKNPTSVGICI